MIRKNIRTCDICNQEIKGDLFVITFGYSLAGMMRVCKVCYINDTERDLFINSRKISEEEIDKKERDRKEVIRDFFEALDKKKYLNDD